MKKTLEVFQIDAFTKTPFEGNSAAVAFSEGLNEKEMQKIAGEMNLSETAFLSKPEVTNDAACYLRWFTPTVEVELCGHGTIASLHFLYEHKILKKNSEIILKTKSGNLNCGINNDKYFMQIPIYKLSEYNGNKKAIIKALGLEYEHPHENLPFIILENGNLYIYVNKLSTLENIKPDFNALINLTEKEKEFSGISVFTLETFEKNNTAHSRYFAPYHGINEDPVTGSANGPLLLVLKRLGLIDKNQNEAVFEQGDFLKRRGRVSVKFFPENNELFIYGNAVTVLKGALSF